MRGARGRETREGVILPHSPVRQSPTQSPRTLWPAVGRQESLWGHRILLPQDFCGKTIETVTEEPIKKFEFSMSPESLLAPTR